MLIVSLILLSVVALLAGTAASAVRIASRTRLIEALKARGREDRLRAYESRERDYELSATAIRMACVLLFVLDLAQLIQPTEQWYIRPATIFVASAFWLLTIGSAIPIAWARYAGESFIVRTLSWLEMARLLCKPILTVIDAIDEIVRRLIGAPTEAADRTERMEREILDAVSEAETVGAVDEAERDMIQSVMDMDDMTVGEIMTPRTDIRALNAQADFEEVRRLVVEAGHSRLPVYGDNLDQILGVMYAKDLLTVSDPSAFDVRKAMRPVTFVPEARSLPSLLRHFQSSRVHIAIVLDEYGGTAGLVTIEDILEELVGEITDEHDADPAVPPINRIDGQTADIDARVRVDEVNDELDTHLTEDEAYDTIGGYVFSHLGHIPEVGEEITADDVRIEVTDIDERKIKRVRVRRLQPAPEE